MQYFNSIDVDLGSLSPPRPRLHRQCTLASDCSVLDCKEDLGGVDLHLEVGLDICGDLNLDFKFEVDGTTL